MFALARHGQENQRLKQNKWKLEKVLEGIEAPDWNSCETLPECDQCRLGTLGRGLAQLLSATWGRHSS